MKSLIVALSLLAAISGCALQETRGATAASTDADDAKANQSPFPRNNLPGIG
jgi:hypothetical protein